MTSPTEDTSAPEEVDPLKVPSDLFGVIIRCREMEVPWRSLLAHAVAIREPLLAIITACENVGWFVSGRGVDIECVSELWSESVGTPS